MVRAEAGALRLRIVSALVLAPVALAAIWFGGLCLSLLTIAAAVVMAWEWARLCKRGPIGESRSGAGVIGASAGAVICQAFGGIVPGLSLAVIGALVVFAIARSEHDSEAGWLAGGVLWVALPCVILLWLAQSERAGRGVLLWLFAVVWATDIGAYAIGRQLGGPLLAPRWSPRKTWAGLIGGIACAALAGWAAAGLLGTASVLPLVAVSAALAVVEQFGDLAESMAKRRFGVKDASSLIPGHGGLLDRLDGLLAVIPAVALLTLWGNASVLTWR